MMVDDVDEVVSIELVFCCCSCRVVTRISEPTNKGDSQLILKRIGQ